jgi:hypothetical protein
MASQEEVVIFLVFQISGHREVARIRAVLTTVSDMWLDIRTKSRWRCCSILYLFMAVGVKAKFKRRALRRVDRNQSFKTVNPVRMAASVSFKRPRD